MKKLGNMMATKPRSEESSNTEPILYLAVDIYQASDAIHISAQNHMTEMDGDRTISITEYTPRPTPICKRAVANAPGN